MVLAVILSGIGPVLVRDSPVDPAATAFWRLFLGLPLALFLVRRSVMLPPRTMFWAALGPTFFTAMSSRKTASSSEEVKPKSWRASSRTWV